MEKVCWLDKVTNEEVLERVNKAKKILNSVWNGKMDWLVTFWDMMACYTRLLKAEWEVYQQERGEEFECYMILQIMTAMLHSSKQQSSEKDGDTEKAEHYQTLSDLTAIFQVNLG